MSIDEVGHNIFLHVSLPCTVALVLQHGKYLLIFCSKVFVILTLFRWLYSPTSLFGPPDSEDEERKTF